MAALDAATPENADKTATAALAVADEAAAVDDFATVSQLLSLADAAANKTKRVAVVAAVQPRIADLRALSAEYERVKAALRKLQSDPADADALAALHEDFNGVTRTGADVRASLLTKMDIERAPHLVFAADLSAGTT